MTGTSGEGVSFLIPLRDDDGTRSAVHEWLMSRRRRRWPAAEFIVAPDDGRDPFSKAQAVNAAADRSRGNALVIVDADAWVPPYLVERALDVVYERHGWVIPAARSRRLDEGTTRRLLAGQRGPVVVEQTVVVVGACFVLSYEAFETAGRMDPRFRGWGGEDGAFVSAVETLWEPAVRLGGTLHEMWHPRLRRDGARVWHGQTDRNSTLARRYRHAAGKPTEMMALTREWRLTR